MTTKIVCKVQKAKKHSLFPLMEYYTGLVTVYENRKYMWSKYSGITRLNREDAMADAEWIKKDIEIS